jgi:hypothetical protein
LEIDPNYAEAHFGLGLALRDQGSFRQALEALQRAHELGSKRDHWTYPTAQWVDECRSLLRLDDQLAAILAGQAQPVDAKHRVALAEMCTRPHRRLHGRAVQFYAEAFAAEPGLADDQSAARRYDAACCAALAASGRAKDAEKADETQRAGWRKQALDWLRADLAHWVKRRASGKPEDRKAVEATSRHWQGDSDLAGVRDKAALDKLPTDEQAAWRQFWAEVAALQERVVP